MRKGLVFALVVCCFVALMAGVAFAQGYYQGGATPYYLAPTVNPHGGFTTTSRNCGVCHSVHHASNSGEALMRGSIADACSYCHIETSAGFVSIYSSPTANPVGSANNYINASDYAHDTSGTAGAAGSDGVLCTNCHQVHAAESQMASENAHLVTKILKSDGNYQDDVESGQVWAIDSGDSTGTAVSKWCTRCHPYYNEYYDGTTHTMRDAGDSYSADRVTGGVSPAGVTGAVAWAPSTYCVSCHQRGKTDEVERVGIGVAVAVQYSFPHFSDGKRWLSTDASPSVGLGSLPVTGTATTDMDGVCLNCHRDGSGVGIGKTF